MQVRERRGRLGPEQRLGIHSPDRGASREGEERYRPGGLGAATRVDTARLRRMVTRDARCLI